MNLAQIAWKSLKQRGLSSALTSLSVALGVMLMVAVLIIYGIVDTTFRQGSIGYDLIVGPKGSPLQLVLSTVYHVSPPIENLPYRFYNEIKAHPFVEKAIPVALGDTSEEGSFPIVGTLPEYFTTEYMPRREFKIKGDLIRKPFDSIIGSRVAAENGWKLGTEFRMVHSGADSGHVHNEKFTVVGILAPTGTPNDKSVFVHLEGFYQIQGHDTPFGEAIAWEREFYGLPALPEAELAAEAAKLEKRYGHHHHDHGAGEEAHDHSHPTPLIQKRVTSILVRTKTPTAAALMQGQFKKGFRAQAINPIQPMQTLLTDVLGNIRLILLILTSLIIVVSGVGIFVSLYNSLSERRREIAIMRALGARRETIVSIIVAESMLLCLIGGLVGLLFGHALVFVAAPIVEQRAGIIVNPFAFDPLELWLLPGLALLAVLVSIGPAMSAYRTDVSAHLN